MQKSISVPPSYALIHQRGLLLLLKEEYKDLLIQQRIEDFETFLKKYGQTSPTLRGRTPLLSVLLNNGEKMVVRNYSHGGLLRFLTRDLYLFGSRSFQELALTEEIRSAGISTVQPIGVVHYRVFPFFYKAYFMSLEIPDARDVVKYLLKMGLHPSREDLIKKRKMIHSVGRLVLQFHQAGFFHRDLQLKNILVAGERPHLIDFDRSYRKKVLTLRKRIHNLLRLNRSVEKWKRLGLPLTRTDRWRFFLAYSGGDPEVREALKKRLRTYGIRFFPHRWMWALQKYFGK
jgi:3-deoxy-D-manno-octulosonic acid kinase